MKDNYYTNVTADDLIIDVLLIGGTWDSIKKDLSERILSSNNHSGANQGFMWSGFVYRGVNLKKESNMIILRIFLELKMIFKNIWKRAVDIDLINVT